MYKNQMFFTSDEVTFYIFLKGYYFELNFEYTVFSIDFDYLQQQKNN